jgi:hypothetical protein
MRRALVLIAVVAIALPVAALAKPPRGAVRGTFTVGILAQSDQLSKYLKASAVWCVWRGGKVIVHVNLRNTAVEHVTATIKPRYFIRRGGEHGSGGFGKDYGFDAGEFRSLWIEEDPKGVPDKTPISRCAPYLFLIKSG